MRKKIVVLGCGLVGSVIAKDLAAQEDFEVIVSDYDADALGRLGRVSPVRLRRADLSQQLEIRDLAAEADVVVGALPGRFGAAMVETVLAVGKPIADISFSPKDLLPLDPPARQLGVTALVDCGVSPGLSNFAVGCAAERLDEVEDVRIFAGGLPVDRGRPYEYALVFSVGDVIEEYLRPARIVEEGRIALRPALSQVETIDVPGIGTLEAFLTDGLRTLLSSVSARSMEEKTVRYPGHADQMRRLREAGFFGEEPIDIGQTRISPRSLTERILLRAWKLQPGQEELTWLRVTVSGKKQGERRRLVSELLDRTDPATGTTSMARTTGFPCALVAGMLARGTFRRPGLGGLESLAADARAAELLVAGLQERGIAWTEKDETIEGSADPGV